MAGVNDADSRLDPKAAARKRRAILRKEGKAAKGDAEGSWSADAVAKRHRESAQNDPYLREMKIDHAMLMVGCILGHVTDNLGMTAGTPEMARFVELALSNAIDFTKDPNKSALQYKMCDAERCCREWLFSLPGNTIQALPKVLQDHLYRYRSKEPDKVQRSSSSLYHLICMAAPFPLPPLETPQEPVVESELQSDIAVLRQRIADLHSIP